MKKIGLKLEDIFDLAVQMETIGFEFYELAAAHVPDVSVQTVLKKLAYMEKGHKAVFLDMKDRYCTAPSDPETDSVLASYLASWLQGKVFDCDRDRALAVARSGSTEEVLALAIQMEKDSIAFYTGLKEYIADPEVETLILRIITDELQHIAEVNAIFSASG